MGAYGEPPFTMERAGEWEETICPNPECKRQLRRLKSDPPQPWDVYPSHE
jgi:hypothetical protein